MNDATRHLRKSDHLMLFVHRLVVARKLFICRNARGIVRIDGGAEKYSTTHKRAGYHWQRAMAFGDIRHRSKS